MFSSKVQEIKESTQKFADNIVDQATAVASEVVDDSQDAAEKISGRISRENSEIKSEIAALLARLHELLDLEGSRDIPRQVHENLDTVSDRVAAWTGERENKIDMIVRNGIRRTSQAVSEMPFTSLAVVAGAGALTAYLLTRRLGIH
jgi:ElaB/YqjD/DUF883 family membrane-anchored ribosome-binding protein